MGSEKAAVPLAVAECEDNSHPKMGVALVPQDGISKDIPWDVDGRSRSQ